jgi:hypothetical protein
MKSREEAAKIAVHVNLDAMLGRLQRGVAAISDNVRFGLASDVESVDMFEAAHTQRILYFTAGKRDVDLDKLRSDFRTWVVGSGIRDCVEQVLLYLDEVRHIATLFSLGANPTILTTDWNRMFGDEQRAFHRLGFQRKLKALAEISSILIPVHYDAVISINRARNCLVHRNGYVQAQDTNEGDELVVRYLRIELGAVLEGHERPIRIGDVVEAGEAVFMKSNVPTEKRFRLGNRIGFSPEEFEHLAFTCYVFGADLRNKVNDFGQNRGIGPPPNAAADGGITTG